MAASSSTTEAEIATLTVAKLRALLDAKEIAHEKKELKAALAAKLKDAMMKEEEGKEEEEKKKTTKKRKASSGSEEEEPLEEERGEEEEKEEDSDEEELDEYEDDGSMEWVLRMEQKIARPKTKRDWKIRESVLTGGGMPDN